MDYRKISLLFALFTFTVTSFAKSYSDYVNPFIGTGALDASSLSGNCYPGATTPFGMVQLSPDTRQDPSWSDGNGYCYSDNRIYGFSHTRLSGTGVSDFIDILLTPTTDTENPAPSSLYSHENEEAHPGYYRVMLQDYGIMAELTATTRCGIHKYLFPDGKKQRVVLDMDHSSKKGHWGRRVIQSQIHIVSPTVVEGYRVITGWAKLRRIYFHMEFSRPIQSHSMVDGSRTVGDASYINGSNLHAYFDFDNSSQKELMVKVSISAVSVENARENMSSEAVSWDFANYRQSASNVWNDYLGRIEVEGNERDMEIFYTALYHALIQPNVMSDVNGEYMAADYSVKRMPEGKSFYSTFSLWDTYRAAHPLYNLVYPEKNSEFVESMLLHHETYGYLPIWVLWGQDNYCMIGNHAIPVIADAVLRGIEGIDGDRALRACVESSTRSHYNSPFELWEKYGYMPDNLQPQSVSITLEQSFDDWCVAQMAKKMGKEDIYERFSKRGNYFANLFNPETGFFQARNDKGEWKTPFDPLKYGANGDTPYTEGNPWQWVWYVPQNIGRLIELIGGNEAFVEKLDKFFTLTETSGKKNVNASGFVGQYIQGNEPGHHAAFLYNYAGEPKKTQEMVHRIITDFYTTESSGYAGNDDCGEMSAWYVFSSMGFYPVNPAGGTYSICSPVFGKVKIHLSNGKIFTVSAPRKDESEIYIKKQLLNGKVYKSTELTYQSIMDGSTFEVQLTNK